MRLYKNAITLVENNRGIWDIDPIKGCYSGTLSNSKGCYGDCYAARNAKRYGLDFTTSIRRGFISIAHLESIRKKLNEIDMQFVRMGCSGDPSEDWEHTLSICELLQKRGQLKLWPRKNKEIVIITKHWTNLSPNQLKRLRGLSITINTSISVLDPNLRLKNNLEQYKILKNYCKSILRIVSCDFNLNNTLGRKLYKRQVRLFNQYNMLDTAFRPSSTNNLLKNRVIKARQLKFNGSPQLISKSNAKTYLGGCKKCPQQCGINIEE